MTRWMSTVAPIIRSTSLGACFLGVLGVVLYFDSVKERRSTSMTPKNTMMEAVIPPIDSQAPARTETATFALG